MKNVIYVVKSLLHTYPPCVTQIRLLNKAGVHVEVLFGSCKDTVTNIFDTENIPYKELKDERGKFSGVLDKINNYYCFRRSLRKELRNRDLKDTIIWFGTAETLLTMKGALSGIEYAVSLLELLDDRPFRMWLLKDLVRKAQFIVSCEETRAYIMRAWWKLKELPYVMPNKPYDNPQVFKEVTDSDAISLLKKIGDKKIIIYQGIIKEKGILENIAKAINELPSDYVLLLMGADPENIIPEIKKITDRVYTGWVTAPNHLQVTSKAYIGLVYYKADSSLNRAYCAPNKIYEYGAFGVPMLANDIPGLKNTVGSCGAAVCSNMSVEEIVKSVHEITDKYELMQKASRSFYESTNIVKIMGRIINDKLMS